MAAVDRTMDAGAAMTSPSIDPTTQLPPGLSGIAGTASQFDLRGVLKRLEGFMGVANLAAEVCWLLFSPPSKVGLPDLYLSCRSTRWSN